jgi:hypothetical protein
MRSRSKGAKNLKLAFFFGRVAIQEASFNILP